MSSDSIHAVEGLTFQERVQSLRMASTRFQALRDELSEDLAQKKQEIVDLAEDCDVHVKVNELYRVLLDKLVLEKVKSIEAVVTTGLQTIFPDQNLSFQTDLGVRGGKVSATFYLCQGDPDFGGIKASPLSAFGGGPSSFVSLVLRVLTLVRLKRLPILFLDESLAAVSDEYIDATGQFLRRLTEESKLDLLLVTHKQAFLDHATVAYQGDSSPMSRKDPGDTRSEFTARRIKAPK